MGEKKRKALGPKKARKLSASAVNDPSGPRAIRLDERATSMTGFGYVSLADDALKLWDTGKKSKAATSK